MDQYTAAVNLMASYIKNTEPIFAVTQGKFVEVQGQLEYALQILKDHPDYDDAQDTMN